VLRGPVIFLSKKQVFRSQKIKGALCARAWPSGPNATRVEELTHGPRSLLRFSWDYHGCYLP